MSCGYATPEKRKVGGSTPPLTTLGALSSDNAPRGALLAQPGTAHTAGTGEPCCTALRQSAQSGLARTSWPKSGPGWPRSNRPPTLRALVLLHNDIKIDNCQFGPASAGNGDLCPFRSGATLPARRYRAMNTSARPCGGNERVNVEPSAPVRTSAVASLACAMRATIASPSPAPGIPRAAGAR